jgi:hypothetical protein
MTCHAQHLGCYLDCQVHSMILKQNRVRPITLLFEVGFYKYFTEWSPYWNDMSRTTFGSFPWRSRSEHDLAAKSCPTRNFVIWSRILKIFNRNDHHIEMTCREQHLGRFLEGQGHSITLQQNRVLPITSLLKSDFKNISQKWSSYWDDVSCTTFGPLPWRSRSQHDLAAKVCPAHNFVIWS